MFILEIMVINLIEGEKYMNCTEKDRVKILNFLQWNDKHGCYTDGNCDLEEISRFTCEDAVKYFFGVINDDFYYSQANNIFELTYEEVINYAKENKFYNDTMKMLNVLLEVDSPTDDFYKSLI